MNTPNKLAVDAAISAAGGRAELARALDITSEAVRQWLENGEIPLRRIKEVSKVTGLPMHELRPDIFGEQQ